MTEKHYENFPVASLFLPRRLRRPVALIYSFARQADDFADEGQLTAAQRLALLQGFRDELVRIDQGTMPLDELFRQLAQIIELQRLPLAPFFDLLAAFSQDVVKQRYADFSELLAYCERSANPVGRILLHLYDEANPENLAASDRICTSLQLINFIQDVAIDLQKGRIYLPLDEMARFGIDELTIASAPACPEWRELIRFQIGRARSMMLEGAPLAKRLPGRIGFEMRLIVEGGLRILEKLDRVDCDMFNRRPKLQRLDWALMLFRAVSK